MTTPFRLPIVGSDDGLWGDELVQWLMKEHFDDPAHIDDPTNNGGHQTVTIRAGSATAGTAPLKFTSGTLLSTPEVGAVEFNGDRLYYTQTTSTTRKVIAAFDDSSGTVGDIYYRSSGASGNLIRLAIGSAGQILTVVSGAPAWKDQVFAYSTKTTWTIQAGDTVIFADAGSGDATITLPAASTLPGYRFYIKRIDGSANHVNIARTSSDTIDGTTGFTLDAQYTSVTVVSDGSNWYII